MQTPDRLARLATRPLTLLLLTAPAAAQFSWEAGVYDVPSVLAAPSPTGFDNYGIAVGLSGDRLVVGSTGYDDAQVNQGVVYVRERNLGGPGNWGLAHTLTHPSPDTLDNLGEAVAIVGSLVVAGAPGREQATLASNEGAVFLYDAVTGALITEIVETAPDLFAFGQAVATDGSHVVAGARTLASGQFDQGRAFVYDSAGNPLLTLNASNGTTGDQFGASVAVGGGVVAVGAPGKFNFPDTQGSVYVYDLATGIELAELIVNGTGNSFGKALDIESGRLIAPASTGPFATTYVFDLATLTQQHAFVGGSGNTGFGQSVGLNGQYAFVGQSGATGQTYRGQVVQYDLDTGEIVAFHRKLYSGTVETRVGTTLAVDGATLASGDPAAPLPGASSEGRVHVMPRAELGFGVQQSPIFASQTAVLQVRGGPLGGPAVVFATAVDGVPLPLPFFIDGGPFDALEHFDLTIPGSSSLAGRTIDLLAGGLTKSGGLAITNPEVIQFL